MAAAKKTAASAEKVLTIEIPAIQLETIQLTVIGDTPLIMHKWSEKAKKEILDKQTGKPKKGKERKNPVEDYTRSMYWVDENGNEIAPPEVHECETDEERIAEYKRIQEITKTSHFGFPTTAFKSCMLDAGYQQGAISKKTTARGAIRILGELAVIEGFPEMREDMVKVGTLTKVADIRYRGEFKEWKTTLTIQYNKTAINASQIANLLNLGGFCCGVGEWRTSRDGSFGGFHVKAD